jgi:xylan 1,4-beta-xylosidase
MQKTGHASLVDTGKGEWYVAHLGARPVMPEMRCVLNRETSLRKAFWTADGWLRLEGGRLPLLEVPAPSGLPAAAVSSPGVSAPGVSSPGVSSPGPDPTASRREDFDGPLLPADFYSLRAAPDPSWLSLSARPGWLRIHGRESLRSLHEQSLVARRVQHFSFRVETALEFRPEAYQQMAGLILMIGTENWYYLRKYWSESLGGPALGIMTCLNGADDELLEHRVALPESEGAHRGDQAGARPGTVFLAAEVAAGRELAFSWSSDGRAWERIGPHLDFTLLSDECSRREAFSGTFCGVCVQDLSGRGAAADFDFFDYGAR